MDKVYIEHSNAQYNELFNQLGFEQVFSPEAADLIVFTGGADVSPAIYGDRPHQYTHSDAFRDAKEARLFEWAVEHDKKLVGICRGGQFLNVMCGGRMYQHVESHCGAHNITDLETGEVIYVSSTHHQMMMPAPGAVLVATSNLRGSREWYDGEVFKRDVSEQDIEVVYYPTFDTLCFQPHPEFDGPQYETMKAYFQHLINKYLEL